MTRVKYGVSQTMWWSKLKSPDMAFQKNGGEKEVMVLKS